MEIAVLGPKGTYTHKAALIYNSKSQVVFFDTIQEVIKAVSEKNVIGIVPFENSLQGTIRETLDNIYEKELKIIQEIILPINHNLASLNSNINKENIIEIYSHPQALGQCKSYIQTNYPKAKLILTPSTAAAFKKIQEEGLSQALAIGPKIAAETYNLQIIDESIQDTKNNQTSFVIISRSNNQDTNPEKTTLVINPQQDKVGLLLEILQIFKNHNVNLSKLESRPSKEKLGSYIFYTTLDTGEQNLVKQIIEKLEQKEMKITSLGSYQTLLASS